MALGLTRTFQSTFITLGAYISIKNFGFRTYISTKICGIRAHISIKIYNFRTYSTFLPHRRRGENQNIGKNRQCNTYDSHSSILPSWRDQTTVSRDFRPPSNFCQLFALYPTNIGKHFNTIFCKLMQHFTHKKVVEESENPLKLMI